MRRMVFLMLLQLLALAMQSGCLNDAPSPPRMPVPAASNREHAREQDYVKPLPPEDWRQERDTAPNRPVEPRR